MLTFLDLLVPLVDEVLVGALEVPVIESVRSNELGERCDFSFHAWRALEFLSEFAPEHASIGVMLVVVQDPTSCWLPWTGWRRRRYMAECCRLEFDCFPSTDRLALTK